MSVATAERPSPTQRFINGLNPTSIEFRRLHHQLRWDVLKERNPDNPYTGIGIYNVKFVGGKAFSDYCAEVSPSPDGNVAIRLPKINFSSVSVDIINDKTGEKIPQCDKDPTSHGGYGDDELIVIEPGQTAEVKVESSNSQGSQDHTRAHIQFFIDNQGIRSMNEPSLATNLVFRDEEVPEPLYGTIITVIALTPNTPPISNPSI